MFSGLVASVMSNIGSKNTQQVQYGVLKALNTYAKVLAAFCTTARLEAALLNTIQVRCVEVGWCLGSPGASWVGWECPSCWLAGWLARRQAVQQRGTAAAQAAYIHCRASPTHHLSSLATPTPPHASTQPTRLPAGDVLRGQPPAQAVCRRRQGAVRRRRAGRGHCALLVRAPPPARLPARSLAQRVAALCCPALPWMALLWGATLPCSALLSADFAAGCLPALLLA